jgi:hypothetical protein
LVIDIDDWLIMYGVYIAEGSISNKYVVSIAANKDRVKEMYLLEIDTSKLSEVIFFKDPNFFQGKAIWTYQNIPPNAIRVSKRIDVTY